MWLKIALLGGEKLSSEAGTQREFPDLNWPSPFNESIIFKRLENIKGCIRCNKMVGERNKCLKKGSFICRLGHSLNTGYESGRSSLVAASYSSRPLQRGWWSTASMHSFFRLLHGKIHRKPANRTNRTSELELVIAPSPSHQTKPIDTAKFALPSEKRSSPTDHVDDNLSIRADL